ncbi:hypothetical protein X772_33690 [Mesorhizobium sp. LSJC280B00]|nr:hypothetical protein X772_33690 [Mesorhizobium sp. LSJC280B00]
MLTICSRVIRVGRASLTFRHDLTGSSGNLHATMEVLSVMFHLSKRAAVALPDKLRSAAEQLLAQDVD